MMRTARETRDDLARVLPHAVTAIALMLTAMFVLFVSASTARASEPGDQAEGCLDFVKSGPAVAQAGGVIQYVIHLRNCGELSIKGVAVYDPMLAPLPPHKIVWVPLGPGESGEWVFDYVVPADASDLLCNTATAVAYVDGAPVIVQDATHCTSLCTPKGPDTNCDGVDDNCDGVADNFFVPLTTQCGAGVCARDGALQCIAGELKDSCVPGTPSGLDKDCDGRDNNCDGLTDEGFEELHTSCGTGACASDGKLRCVDGSRLNTCVPKPKKGPDTTCDGVDDNCDGATDNYFIPLATRCGEGVCASKGRLHCADGEVTDSCEPGPPLGFDDTCDTLDDDCDGDTDEDCVTGDCGDGVVQSELGEECDDGDTLDGDGCSAECLEELCVEDLGLPGTYNVFVFDTYTGGLDVGGGVAAGTLIEMASFSVGHAAPGGDILVSGGDLELSSGSVYGNAWYGVDGVATVADDVDLVGGTLAQGSPIDFAAAEDAMRALSARLAALPANGTVDVMFAPWATQITLGCEDPNLCVFALSGYTLSSAVALSFDVPEGATLIVNVDGPDLTMHNFGFFPGATKAGHVLFNMPQATSLEVRAIGVYGSLLAPYADLVFENGAWDGSIVARSLDGGGEPHWVPFKGKIPCPELL